MQNTTKKDDWLVSATPDDYEYTKVLCAIGKVSKMLYLSMRYVSEDEIFDLVQSEVRRRRLEYTFFQPSWARALKGAMKYVIRNYRDDFEVLPDAWPFKLTRWSARYKAEAVKAMRNLSIQVPG